MWNLKCGWLKRTSRASENKEIAIHRIKFIFLTNHWTVFYFYDAGSLSFCRFCWLVGIRLRGFLFFAGFCKALLMSIIYPQYTSRCCFLASSILIILFLLIKESIWNVAGWPRDVEEDVKAQAKSTDLCNYKSNLYVQWKRE